MANEFKDIKDYNGQQVVMNGKRLVLNSYLDSTLIRSGQYINLSAKEKITFDIGDKDSDNLENEFIVNARIVQLGLKTKGRTLEPSVKGDALETTINDQNDAVTTYGKLMEAAVAFPPLAAIASVYLNLKMANIKTSLAEVGNVKSDTVYSI